jgi:hypothetical protein
LIDAVLERLNTRVQKIMTLAPKNEDYENMIFYELKTRNKSESKTEIAPSILTFLNTAKAKKLVATLATKSKLSVNIHPLAKMARNCSMQQYNSFLSFKLIYFQRYIPQTTGKRLTKISNTQNIKPTNTYV